MVLSVIQLQMQRQSDVETSSLGTSPASLNPPATAFDAPGELPSTSNAEAPHDTISAVDSLQERKVFGFTIPPCLQKILDFIDVATKHVITVAGCVLKYAGFIFLIIGIVQLAAVIFSFGGAAIATGSVTVLINELIKQGVVMCISGGGVMYGLGKKMMDDKDFDLIASSIGFVWSAWAIIKGE